MTIHLLDGSDADSNGITFVESTYHFFLKTATGGQLDITDLIDRPTKRSLVPAFDDQKENLRISTQGGLDHPEPTNQHGTMTKPYDQRGFWEVFGTGVSNDLRSLPGGATNILIPLAVIVIGVALIIHQTK